MKIVTHNGKFHTDDVLSAAALLSLYPQATITRTREQEIIDSADIVFDVGQIYDPQNNRFDHHQREGAGERKNGIPYSSFGIVWQKFGEQLTGSKEAAEIIDRILVQQIDASDNGKDTFILTSYNIKPVLINDIVDSYRPSAKEEEDWDSSFDKAVSWAKEFINRLIKLINDQTEINHQILRFYEQNKDKDLLIFPEDMILRREWINGVLSSFPTPLLAAYKKSDGQWQLLTLNENLGSFALRKPLPESWRGKTNEDLKQETGVNGALFCHRSGFMCLAQTKEAIIKLAEIALNS